jgi:hypothetical protein
MIGEKNVFAFFSPPTSDRDISFLMWERGEFLIHLSLLFQLLPMFYLASRAFKYCMLSLFGFMVACLISAILGVFSSVEPVMQFLGIVLAKLTALTLCFLVSAVIFESLRR